MKKPIRRTMNDLPFEIPFNLIQEEGDDPARLVREKEELDAAKAEQKRQQQTMETMNEHM